MWFGGYKRNLLTLQTFRISTDSIFCHCAVVFCNVNLQFSYRTLSHDGAATRWTIQLWGRWSRKWDATSLPGNRSFVKPCISYTKPFVFSFGFLLSLASVFRQFLLIPAKWKCCFRRVQSETSCTCLGHRYLRKHWGAFSRLSLPCHDLFWWV